MGATAVSIRLNRSMKTSLNRTKAQRKMFQTIKAGWLKKMSVVVEIVSVFLIIFIVPFVIYGLNSKWMKVKTPENPGMFMLGVAIEKIGASIGFVILFEKNWIPYSLVWFVMFALGEIGRALGPDYSSKEALLGIASEAIYLPLSGYVVDWLRSGRTKPFIQ